MYIRYFLYRLFARARASDRRNRLRIRSMADRSVSTGFHSIWYSLQAGYKNSFFRRVSNSYWCVRLNHRALLCSVFFVLFLCLSLSHVAHESTSLNGKIDWRRWRVTNRESRAILYAALVTKILLRFIETLFYLRISH